MSPCRVVLFWCACMLPCAQSASLDASTQDRPPRGRIRVLVVADTEHASPGYVTRQVDVEESANELRKRVKGLEWTQPAKSVDDADLTVTVTGRVDRGLADDDGSDRKACLIGSRLGHVWREADSGTDSGTVPGTRLRSRRPSSELRRASRL
jgi:hypothetical protein